MSAIDNERASAARLRLLRMHFESGVGHIGGNLSVLDCLLVLFHEQLKSCDRLILSKGHAAGALYVSLWSVGKLTDDALKTFHREDTLLPGHPPARGIAEVLFATGSLGHGLSLAAGTALAQRFLPQSPEAMAHVYCVTSDGEWQEGSTWEALMFVQHHTLVNLTVFIDHNGLQGFGSTHEIASFAPLWDRLAGFDVDVSIIDGHDAEAIREAAAKRGQRPHFVFMQTVKGKGVTFMENKMEWHYLPLNAETYAQAVAEQTRESAH